jgi:hypothetical protein
LLNITSQILRIGDENDPIVRSTNVIELPLDICLETDKIQTIFDNPSPLHCR